MPLSLSCRHTHSLDGMKNASGEEKKRVEPTDKLTHAPSSDIERKQKGEKGVTVNISEKKVRYCHLVFSKDGTVNICRNASFAQCVINKAE